MQAGESSAVDWSALRDHFPSTRDYIYADSAAVGALPQDAVDAASTAFARLSQQGMAAYLDLKAQGESVRQQTADFFGVEPAGIGYTDCTSTSMNLLAMMARQEWETSSVRRDEVVMPKGEFPSSTLGWLHQGFTPKWVRAEADFSYPVEKILDRVGPKTRAVVTSQVQYQTGLRMDVETLSKELAARGIWHVMNATQAAGVIPQAAAPFTAVTATAVKWLCSGLGNGIVHLSDELRQECRMPVAGWIAQRDAFAMISDEVQLKTEASGLETGATDVVRLHVLGANLSLMQQAGPANIHARVLALNGLLMDGLAELGAKLLTPREDARRAGIVSVRHARAREWSAWAKERKLLHSVRGEDVVRFSLHYFNNEDDARRILELWPQGPQSKT